MTLHFLCVILILLLVACLFVAIGLLPGGPLAALLLFATMIALGGFVFNRAGLSKDEDE